jgi:hypothetical protein
VGQKYISKAAGITGIVLGVKKTGCTSLDAKNQ